jgi:hypothetical protein
MVAIGTANASPTIITKPILVFIFVLLLNRASLVDFMPMTVTGKKKVGRSGYSSRSKWREAKYDGQITKNRENSRELKKRATSQL